MLLWFDGGLLHRHGLRNYLYTQWRKGIMVIYSLKYKFYYLLVLNYISGLLLSNNNIASYFVALLLLTAG